MKGFFDGVVVHWLVLDTKYGYNTLRRQHKTTCSLYVFVFKHSATGVVVSEQIYLILFNILLPLATLRILN